MSESKKVKQSSVRYFEEDLEKISELAKDLGVTQADIVGEWRKSYERLTLEKTSSQGENLRTLRSYSDKIINLFTTITESTEETISNEQERSTQSQSLYEGQVIKTNEIKTTLENQIKEHKQEFKKLTKELEKYSGFEETVEGRIKDKDEIIESKNKNILSLTEELSELKEVNKSLKEFEKKEIIFLNDIKNLKNDLKEKDFENKQQQLELKQQLQDEFATRNQSFLEIEYDKREKARDEIEKRLHSERQSEIKEIREQQQKEIERIRKEHTAEINKIEERHSNEVKNTKTKP